MIRTSLFLIAIVMNCVADEWPQFLGPMRNGHSAETNLAVQWPSEGPKTLWSMKVGQGWSGPVISSNRMIVFHRMEDRETVDCVNAATGARIWRNDYVSGYSDDFGFEEGPRATPAIANGRVFTFGANGILTCWDFSNGTNVWQIDTRKQFDTDKGFFGIACSPLVEGKNLILNIGGKDGAGIVAFDVGSGKVSWKATQQDASYSSPIAADIGGARRLFVLGRSALVALEPGSGKVFWEFPFRPRIQASVTAAVPLVIGDQIFLSASYGAGAALLRFAETKPEVIWKKDGILSNHYATSVHHRGFLYGFDDRQEQRCHLRCVELATGKVRWSEEHFGAGTLMVVGNHLLILSERGELLLAKAIPDKFTVVSRAQILGSEVRAHAALSNGRFYARDKRNLICVGLSSNHL